MGSPHKKLAEELNCTGNTVNVWLLKQEVGECLWIPEWMSHWTTILMSHCTSHILEPLNGECIYITTCVCVCVPKAWTIKCLHSIIRKPTVNSVTVCDWQPKALALVYLGSAFTMTTEVRVNVTFDQHFNLWLSLTCWFVTLTLGS